MKSRDKLVSPRAIAELIAEHTGEPVVDMLQRLRNEREAGMHPRGEFGPGTPAQSTARSAAIQLIGWTAERAYHAAPHVKTVAQLAYDPERYRGPRFTGSGADDVVPLLRGRTFVDALTSLLQALRDPTLQAPVYNAVIELGVTQFREGTWAWIEARPRPTWHTLPVRISFGRLSPSKGVPRRESIVTLSLLGDIAHTLGTRKRKTVGGQADEEQTHAPSESDDPRE